jgi:hypothetical protein
MSVMLHEDAISRFFHSESGPVGRLIARKADEIEAHARNNAAAHVRSGDLIGALGVRGPFQDPDSVYMLVGTSATHPWRGHEPFNYPIALELGGVTPGGAPYHYPFLTPAIQAAGFRRLS